MTHIQSDRAARHARKFAEAYTVGLNDVARARAAIAAGDILLLRPRRRRQFTAEQKQRIRAQQDGYGAGLEARAS
jgi:hypothetical protein